MFATPSLWLVLVLWASQELSVVAVDSGGNSVECVFAVNQLEFNLCPLLEVHSAPLDITIDEETPPTHTKNVYAVSFGGPLRRDGTLPAELQCPDGDGFNPAVVNTRPNHPSEPSRILQVIPVAGVDANPKAILGKKVHENDHHAPLQVTLHGGSYMQQKQKATFIFHCDPNADEPTLPSFMWKFNGTHTFSWKTMHACHKPLSTPQPNPPEPDADPPQDPPKDPESDHNEDINDPPSHSSPMFTFFWIAVLTLIIARLIFLLLPRRYPYHRIASRLAAVVTRGIQPLLSMRFLPQSLYTGKEQRVDHHAYPGIGDDEGEEVLLTPSTPNISYYGSFQDHRSGYVPGR